MPKLGRGLHPTSWACLVAAVLVVGGAHVLARQEVHRSEERLLDDKGETLQVLSQQVISRVETAVASVQSVAVATGGDAAAFRRAVETNTDSALLTSAVFLASDGERLATAGKAPALPDHLSPEQQQRLAEAAATTGLVWLGRFEAGLIPRLGFAYGPGFGPRGAVTYVEMAFTALPQMLRTAPTLDEGIDGLQFVVYAGAPSERPEDMVMAFARKLPLDEPTTVIPVRVGVHPWTVVVSSTKPLVSDLEEATPWILVGAGLLATGLLVAVVEVSHRRRKALAAREKRFRLLVQHSSDITTVMDADLNIRYQTPSGERVLGYPAGTLRDHHPVDLVHPDDAGRLRAAIEGAMAEPEASFFLTCRVLDAGGRWRRVEANGRNLLHEPVVGGVVLNWRDITERAEAEEGRALLASIIEATPDLVVTSDPDGRVLFLNAAGRAMAGIAGDENVADRRLSSLFAAWVGEDILPAALADAFRLGTWSGEMAIAGETEETPVLSVIVTHRDAGGDVRYVSTIARDISERKKLEDQLAHQAFHDPLTDLPNRALFADRLDLALHRSRRSLEPVAVVLIDLDDFKTVNDSLGHVAGDTLLVAAGERLRGCLRTADTLARLGGDEFAVVLEEAGGDAPVRLAERIVKAFSLPFPLGDREVVTTASVGITMVSALEAAASEDVLRAADVALYAAKSAGKTRYSVFEPTMLLASSERLELQADLHRALERDELVLHYQPVVELATGRMTGVEALLRWRHPKLGLVPPARFVPLAEETGLIVPIGRWAVHEASRQVGEWQAQHPEAGRLQLSVNVSGRQLTDPGFTADVATALETSRLPAGQLLLEITESVLVHQEALSRHLVGQLKALGVRVAIDDFGTGYSAFGALAQLPVDVLKIDKSFVGGVHQGSGSNLVHLIVRLGAEMGLDMVAEGIENEDQAVRLAGLACPSGQGYHFGRPVEADLLEPLLGAFLPADGAVLSR